MLAIPRLACANVFLVDRELKPILIRPEAYKVVDLDVRVRDRTARLTRPGAAETFSRDSNLLGVVGELAVVTYLDGVLPVGWVAEWVADRPSPVSDVLVYSEGGRSIRLEVKTTTRDRWSRHGRIIDEDQMYETDADAYVWCVAERSIHPPDVYLVGWSPIDEVRSGWSAATFTGRREPRLVTSRGEYHEPPSVNHRFDYDFDDHGVDEYEEQAAPWYSSPTLDDPELAVLRQEAVVSTHESPKRPTEPNWAEGNDPLDGFGKMNDLARVTAVIRPMSSVVGVLRSL
jgi:hypothetical protein